MYENTRARFYFRLTVPDAVRSLPNAFPADVRTQFRTHGAVNAFLPRGYFSHRGESERWDVAISAVSVEATPTRAFKVVFGVDFSGARLAGRTTWIARLDPVGDAGTSSAPPQFALGA